MNIQQGMNGNTLIMANRDDLERAFEKVLTTFMEKMTMEIEAKKTDEVLLTENEVQQRLNVTHATLWRWNKLGYLRNVKIGRRCMWKQSEIEKMLNQ